MTDQEMFNKIESALHEVYMTHTLLRRYNRGEMVNHLGCLLDVIPEGNLVSNVIKKFIAKNMENVNFSSCVMFIFGDYRNKSLFYRIFMDEIARLNFVTSP